jgi:hypothetical protein
MFRECDGREIVKQIGMMNIFAISGGRIEIHETGIVLPVGKGYYVFVDLAGNDTYTVRRMFKRSGRFIEKGIVEGVYCDQIGEVAYRASCFVNVPFGQAA